MVSMYLPEEGAVHYAINSILYITTLSESILKYMKNLCQLMMHASTIRVLSRGHLPISLLPPNEN